MLALVALDLHATIDVHPLVATQVGELRVRLEAHLAPEGFHRRVDVLVLFEARRGGKGFAALAAGVTTGADVLRANVSLQIRRVREDFLAALANVAPAFVVSNLMSDEIRFPIEYLGTLIALVLPMLASAT